MDFQLKYEGSIGKYELFFMPNNRYLVQNVHGTHTGIILYPLFNENVFVEGVTFSGSAVTPNLLYKDVTGIGVQVMASSSGETVAISSGTTMKFYGRK